ncbi:3-(3-hydroxyphenyl)propionate hydroxylase [Saccharopolyspora subtropica]|uniref:3-(3-hydroxyphenyl)propionate hydroxylase n=1 Tax=Saccharopolyspora thermophila TaxID=89367 RepID=A0A917JIX2_9PSEU|nr:FAD-dependent monooxygenase [Saccharopolyspora subtropica]GGI69490.1 3-(3-hydroxyphenyl)propionate hydroxylase [Saccharopolyspora subtropica]
MAEQTRVLVVGAGPTGLAVACELLRAGVPVRVVEAGTERSPRSKGIAIWPRTLEILHDLGIAEEATARGLPLRKGTLWSQGQPLTTFDLTDLRSRFGWGLVLPQYETESLLERRLVELGGKVEKGVRCAELSWSASGLPRVALVSSAGTEQAEVDWLIACDGPGSTIRAAAGIDMAGELERYGWVLADVRMDTELPRDGVNWFLHRDAVLHALPMPGDQWRLTMTVGRERPDPAQWPVERIQRILDERSPVPMRLSTAEWVSGFRVRQGIARQFRRGRVLLAGDAAHVHSPAGAQGVNAGLQDAANLGWKLALVCRGDASPTLLDSYDAERRPAASLTVRLANRATRGATLASAAARAGRDLIWSTAGRRGVVQRVVPPAVSGVLQSYPAGLTAASGPLLAARRLRSVVDLVRGRPGTGARLPDVRLVDGWLWDLLPATGPVVLAWAGRGRAWDDVDGFTALHRAVPRDVPVLVFDSPGAPADAIPDSPRWRVVADFGGRVRRALAAGPDTAVVVRPDRYLGARGSSASPGAVRSYFKTVGGTP